VLIQTHRQEALSRAYIQAVTARCGMSCSFRDFDYGIDVTLHEITRRENRYVETGFNLDIQAKSTINAIVEEQQIKYDLEVKAYDDLRDTEVGTPRILVVLCLPPPEGLWMAMTDAELVLRRCAYWLSLRGWDATTNQDTVRVPIPRANRFWVEGLQGIMRQIRAGEDL
jgi:Domain of unknown function (DUF4365)